MARSPTHKFGQIIGNLVEDTVESLLQEVADKHDLYLDREGPRPARSGKKLRWNDKFGNDHDLDYVIERGGTDEEIGEPRAFIEVAWRRYTKHSRNKAQEIQGAVRPLAETYSEMAPFLGAVISGVFTDGSIEQLESLGFSILYFEYKTITQALSKVNIDAYWDEDTDNSKVQKEVDKWKNLNPSQKEKIRNSLVSQNEQEIVEFKRDLDSSLERDLDYVLVLPLHGEEEKLVSIEEAINYINSYQNNNHSFKLQKIEIELRYSNGDKVTSEFQNKKDAVRFLNYLAPEI